MCTSKIDVGSFLGVAKSKRETQRLGDLESMGFKDTRIKQEQLY